MKILNALLTFVLLFSINTAHADSCQGIKCIDDRPTKSKDLVAGKNLVCFNFRQDQRGKTVFSIIGKNGQAMRIWRSTKGVKFSYCIPRGYLQKAKSAIICGCFTSRYPNGRSWRVGKGDDQYLSRRRGASARLNLCK